jgi:Tol biopolymer transport system component
MGGSFNIFRRAADGTGDAELVRESQATQMLSDVAADEFLVVSETRPGRDLFDLMMLTVGNPFGIDTLLSTPAAEFNAVVSPDRRYIAYQSNATGQYEVFVSPLESAARTRWKVSIDGGERPVWSMTGDTLFYESKADSMMAATVRRSPTFEVRSTSGLFLDPTPGAFGVLSGRPWDISPRDGRFLFAKFPPRSPGGGARVVTGWDRELLEAMHRR